jgi:triosephosphate isomerase
MRRPIIVGNWKMNKTVSEAVTLVQDLIDRVGDVDNVDIGVGPPFTALNAVVETCAGTNVAVAAQNIFWEDSGAFTGEISPGMLVEIGCKYAIIGHSERRTIMGETDEMVNKKLFAALKHNLTPIVCIGETLDQRELNQTFDIIETQVNAGLAGLSPDEAKIIVLAYEPIWAIGTGKTATPDQAQEIHAFIRKKLAELFNTEVADAIRIQYGGSVKPENIVDLMAQEDLDGALVGGASLKADSFANIIKFG